jgi:hypothetical protein
MNRNATAPSVGPLFFPQSRSLGIDLGAYSPAVLKKVVYAGTQHPSFAQGHQALAALAGLKVAEKQVERLTERIGQERVDQQDQAVQDFLALPLMEKVRSPVANPPDLVVVEMDGGRLQILDRRGSGTTADGAEDEDQEASERQGHWREDKIGLLMTMTSKESAEDPCPEIPESFIDPTRILKLAREIKHGVVAGAEAVAPPPETESEGDEQPDAEWIPKPRVRTVIAGRRSWDRFRDVLAQAAWARGFAAARRKAFVADGAAVNWTSHKKWFSDYVGILDFIHALSYVFAAAMAGRPFRDGWNVYVGWISQVWSGQVAVVIAALEARGAELGAPEKDDPETSPRRVVAEALSYLSNHQGRMHYDQYRRTGLPITSSHMESTVKLFNRRVKGTEKFWSEAGAEAILKLRADYLSETDPMEAYWKNRQEAATGRRQYRRSG